MPAARTAKSTFAIGGRDFTVPQLSAEVLHDIREGGRRWGVENPILARWVALRSIYVALREAYPDLDLEWLIQNLGSEAAIGIYANLGAQIEIAVAEQKAGGAMGRTCATPPHGGFRPRVA